MNPQVKEFAAEARFITVDGITRYALDNEFEQRFAELIVRECMTNLYLNGYDDAVIQIQKHFGVEE
jgi:hypothetical protein